MLKAFDYYQKSANQEYLNAIFCFEFCYINGIETEINKEKGFELYNEAVRTKHFDVHKLSYDNLMSNLEKINYWYHKTANDDNKVALYNLGEIYETEKSSEGGNGNAKKRLTNLQEQGEGTELNINDAIRNLVKV
ncbi:4634_t:CDS:2 [Funneliformis geosporum]|nr:4634_t:CDS:2 [Funneliformis geosporum]